MRTWARRSAGRATLVAIATLLFFAVAASALAPGDLDTSFGSGGVVLNASGADSFGPIVLADGKLLVGTSNAGKAVVLRFNPDGTLDSSFGSGGMGSLQLGDTAGGILSGIARAPDGKIAVAGGFPLSGHEAFAVGRFNADGSPDTGFGSGGKVVMQLGLANVSQYSFANAVAVQPDGKVVAAGGASDSAGRERFAAVRLDATNGSLDPSFNGTGTGQTINQIGAGSAARSWANALAIQPDGRILATGRITDTNGNYALGLVRLLGDGNFDGQFGSGGKFIDQASSDATPSSWGTAVALQQDGRILAGGTANIAGRQAFLVGRYTAGGQPDSSFGSAGRVLSQLGANASPQSEVTGLAVQPNGKIVAGGAASDVDGHYALLAARLNGGDGAFDSTFGSGGKVVRQASTDASPYTFPEGVALQADGKIVETGIIDANNTEEVFLARLIGDAPPTAAFTVSPSPAAAGQALTFDGSGSADQDGTISAYRWDFGDGATDTAAKPSHTYGAPGTYTVSLRVTDDDGLTGSTTQALTVNAPPSLVGPPVLQPPAVPALTGLAISPKAFAPRLAGGSVAVRRGATVRYRDTVAAITTFTVQRAKGGIRRGKRCVAPTRRNRHGRRCTRYVSVGHFRRVDAVGANRFGFTGRVSRHALKRGRYRLRAVPRLAGRNGAAKTVRFRIVRAR